MARWFHVSPVGRSSRTVWDRTNHPGDRFSCMEEGGIFLPSAEQFLIVDIGSYRGIIPREEGALGIAEGTTRDIAIISRVNKPAACLRV